MQTFNIRDLRRRTGELVRDAETGKLSLVTKYGRPVFVALPISQHLLEAGVHHALAVKLFEEGILSLGKAARVADLPVERFLDVLSAAGVDAVDYPPQELDDEMAHLEES